MLDLSVKGLCLASETSFPTAESASMTINKKTLSKRGKSKHTDYIRHYGPNIPLMVIEAKDDNHSVGAGIQQALGYADDVTALSLSTLSGKALAAGESPDEITEVYCDIPGFCKNAILEEIDKHGFVLTPGRYVGAEEAEDDGVSFAEKMEGLTRELATQFHESEKNSDKFISAFSM